MRMQRVCHNITQLMVIVAGYVGIVKKSGIFKGFSHTCELNIYSLTPIWDGVRL